MGEIAELLKQTREESGIELEEVSKDLGIEEIVLHNIEEGKVGGFKDVFLLKEYISNYSKYLGLDSEKILDEFNEYLFEYTSKIPVDEIEKTIKTTPIKEDEISSPYTTVHSKSNNKIYIVIYILILLLVIMAIFWSVNQVTASKKSAYIISYRK